MTPALKYSRSKFSQDWFYFVGVEVIDRSEEKKMKKIIYKTKSPTPSEIYKKHIYVQTRRWRPVIGPRVTSHLLSKIQNPKLVQIVETSFDDSSSKVTAVEVDHS